MKNQKFKVGDRVRIVRGCIHGLEGTLGTILEIDESEIPYCVNPDSFKSNTDRFWCVEVERVKPKKHPVIVITSDGKTTTATVREGKKVLKTATAKCSAKDEFDFSEGARIAFERLQGREPFKKEEKKERPKKLVCVKCDGFFAKFAFTEGKAYKIRWFGDNLFATLNGGYSGHKECDKYVVGFVPGQAEFIPFVED